MTKIGKEKHELGNFFNSGSDDWMFEAFLGIAYVFVLPMPLAITIITAVAGVPIMIPIIFGSLTALAIVAPIVAGAVVRGSDSSETDLMNKHDMSVTKQTKANSKEKQKNKSFTEELINNRQQKAGPVDRSR